MHEAVRVAMIPFPVSEAERRHTRILPWGKIEITFQTPADYEAAKKKILCPLPCGNKHYPTASADNEMQKIVMSRGTITTIAHGSVLFFDTLYSDRTALTLSARGINRINGIPASQAGYVMSHPREIALLFLI